MLTVVAYDITDQRRLRQVAKICEDYGVLAQYSVFECRLEADKFDKFWSDLLDTINFSTDRLVAHKVCVACARDIRSAGTKRTGKGRGVCLLAWPAGATFRAAR